mgnify:CR=1 FL=1
MIDKGTSVVRVLNKLNPSVTDKLLSTGTPVCVIKGQDFAFRSLESRRLPIAVDSPGSRIY